jgi:hypothetical protein
MEWARVMSREDHRRRLTAESARLRAKAMGLTVVPTAPDEPPKPRYRRLAYIAVSILAWWVVGLLIRAW